MLSVEDAREHILSYFEPLPEVEIPLLDGLGLILAEDLTAEFDIPPRANSAMDGYAVRIDDVKGASNSSSVILPLDGTIAAGDVPERPIAKGTAVRIMTGAPVPENADAVVAFEDTDEEARRRHGPITEIGIRRDPEQFENIRPAGEDVRKGHTVVSKGSEITPGIIGVAASLGRTTVTAIRRPVVAIVSTGDEIIEPGADLEPGKIYNSNAYSVRGTGGKTRCRSQHHRNRQGYRRIAGATLVRCRSIRHGGYFCRRFEGRLRRRKGRSFETW